MTETSNAADGVKKCELLADGGMQLCAAMERYVRPSGDGYKGLFFVETISLERNPTVRTIGVKMRNGARDNGVMLNVCPWCKEGIQGWAAPPEPNNPGATHER